MKLAALILAAFAMQSTAPSGTTYHSDTMHFDYTYPEGYHTAGATQSETGKKKGAKGVAACRTLPVTVMDMRKGFHMILLLQFDTECFGKSAAPGDLPDLAGNELEQMLEGFGTPKSGTRAEYELAGHSASLMSGSVKLDVKGNPTLHGVTTCSLIGKDIACWEFLSDDCAALSAMAAYPVTFADQPPEPVIPETIKALCKP